VTGVVWAAAAGIGFGAFQTVNRRAVSRMDVVLATVLQLAVALVVLIVLVAGTGDGARIASLPASAAGWFVLGGLAHFLIGWTVLNTSQQRIGAARTSALISTVPLFGAAVAAVTLGELPSGASWVGIALITLGAYVVAAERILRGRGGRGSWRDSAFGLACAVAWAVSPVFTRKGLDEFDAPLLGVTIGLAASLLGYGLALASGLRADWLGRRRDAADVGVHIHHALTLKVAAGVLVARSTWGRWVALERTTVGTVLALGLLSVPVVLLLSPVVMGRDVERVNIWIWLGAALVVGGALLLVARGR
jgi:drug/metabolite transporter (DMT)-like permease